MRGSTSGLTRNETGATLARAACDRVQELELGRRLHVEAVDPCGERGSHLVGGLADAGEDDLSGFAARGEDTRELAPRDDVEAAAGPREQVEHREVRIRLDRIADEMRDAGEGRVEFAEAALDRGARVDEARRAEPLRDRGQRHVLGAELAVAELEPAHCFRGVVAGSSSAGAAAAPRPVRREPGPGSGSARAAAGP